MTTEMFSLRAKLARRMPDPVFGSTENIQHHIFLLNTKDVPRDLPMEANARRPNTRKQIYREVRQSLISDDGMFHLKNKGIVIVAESVSQKSGANDEYTIHLDRTRQGILDGGHTYKLIVEAQDSNELPEEQFVFVHVRTGIPNNWVPEIAQGLNTSVQVQDMSLDNLAGRFAWLQDTLKGTPYFNSIAWSENDAGDYNARDIIALMYLFNTKLFPASTAHPVAAYEKKAEALRAFEASDASFRNLGPILKDILVLHDILAFTAADLYNKGMQKHGRKGRGGGLSFVKSAGRKKFKGVFQADGIEHQSMLEDGALYPFLGAFRVYVETDLHSGKARWSGGFGAVRAAWENLAYELMTGTLNKTEEIGKSPNAIGKSRPHWDNMYKTVQNYRLQQLVNA